VYEDIHRMIEEHIGAMKKPAKSIRVQCRGNEHTVEFRGLPFRLWAQRYVKEKRKDRAERLRYVQSGIPI
jgi:hypothetical protein